MYVLDDYQYTEQGLFMNGKKTGDTIVLKFKHHSPFDGCFWQYEYIAITPDGPVGIAWTRSKRTGGEYSYLEVIEALVKGSRDRRRGKFTDLEVLVWNNEISENIHARAYPAFYRFARESGLEFTWRCENCGGEQDEPPVYVGTTTTSAIFQFPDGYLCFACARPCEYCGELLREKPVCWCGQGDEQVVNIVGFYEDGLAAVEVQQYPDELSEARIECEEKIRVGDRVYVTGTPDDIQIVGRV